MAIARLEPMRMLDQLYMTTEGIFGIPLSVSSKAYHSNLGDVVITTTFSSYDDVTGLRLPTSVTSSPSRIQVMPSATTTLRRGRSFSS